jgi:hypothetical protein
MRFLPHSQEGWERFGLVTLGSLVVGLGVFLAASNHELYGIWVYRIFLLASVALSIALIAKRRTVLGVGGLFLLAFGLSAGLVPHLAR